MKIRESILLLLGGPTLTVFGIDMLSRDAPRGFIIILMSVFLTAIGSHWQWVGPKNRSKLWLLFPAIFSGFGYAPLMLLGGKKWIINRIGESLTSVAANITKYYLELKRNYYNSFNDEATLLATTGLLEAQSHIEQEISFLEEQSHIEQKISLSQILNIAKKSVLANEGALVEFIINLEIELFRIEAPEFGISEVTEACFEKRRDIECVVQKTKREYQHETDIAWTISKFMKSYPFKAFRNSLGIND